MQGESLYFSDRNVNTSKHYRNHYEISLKQNKMKSYSTAKSTPVFATALYSHSLTMDQLRCQECSLVLRDLNRGLPGAGNIKLSSPPPPREQRFKTDSYGSKPKGKINKQRAKLTHQHDAREERIKYGVCILCVCVYVCSRAHLNLCECACMHTLCEYTYGQVLIEVRRGHQILWGRSYRKLCAVPHGC